MKKIILMTIVAMIISSCTTFVPSNLEDEFLKDNNSEELVVFVHGFFAAKTDMYYLNNKFRGLNYSTIVADMPATYDTIEDCVAELDTQISEEIKKYKTVSFVVHSMGGLILRQYLENREIDNINAIVFIATPHKGTEVADNMSDYFKKRYKAIPQLTTTYNNREYNEEHYFKIGSIAGNKSCKDEPGDIMVTVDSVKTEDADEFIVLPYTHFSIHHKIETFEYVARFLQTSSFYRQ